MRYLKYFSLLFTALFLLSSCSQPVQKDSIDDITESTTDNINITGATTDKPKPWEEDMGYAFNLSKVTTELSEYNGEELTVTIKITNNGQSFDQAFLLYVNGERNDYSTDDGNGKYHLDLKGINACLLRKAGINRIFISGFCTCCEKDMFYSYRREAGRTGRMCAGICLV